MGLIFLYFASSQIIIPATGWREVYPFFRWSLFSDSNPNIPFFRLKVSLGTPAANTALNTKADPACYIEDCDFINKKQLSRTAFWVIQQSGGEIKKDPKAPSQLEALIKRLSKQVTHYPSVSGQWRHK